MTAQELIESLAGFDPNLEVCFYSENSYDFGIIHRVAMTDLDLDEEHAFNKHQLPNGTNKVLVLREIDSDEVDDDY